MSCVVVESVFRVPNGKMVLQKIKIHIYNGFDEIETLGRLVEFDALVDCDRGSTVLASIQIGLELFCKSNTDLFVQCMLKNSFK